MISFHVRPTIDDTKLSNFNEKESSSNDMTVAKQNQTTHRAKTLMASLILMLIITITIKIRRHERFSMH